MPNVLLPILVYHWLAAFDLIVAAEYYTKLTNKGWLYCPVNNIPLLIYPYTNACPRCLLQSNFYYHQANKLPSGTIGTLYQQILGKMANLGYNISVGVLLAADFGTPQLRRRLFYLGCRKDIGSIRLPLSTHSPELELFGLLPYVTVGKAFVDLPEAEFSR